MPLPRSLPPLETQARRLIELEVHLAAGVSEDQLHATAEAGSEQDGHALLVIHHHHAPASLLAPLLDLRGSKGFVVVDMEDVDSFTPVDGIDVPAAPVYIVRDVDRGDDLANWSPNEALPEIVGRGRTPLLLTEGIHWVLQQPEALERNHCFMTIGSRRRKDDHRLDSRTPAVWISNGTGRDGVARKNAPKVGWCWPGNRHQWLGFASGTSRSTST